jgi:hypothetical protein
MEDLDKEHKQAIALVFIVLVSMTLGVILISIML